MGWYGGRDATGGRGTRASQGGHRQFLWVGAEHFGFFLAAFPARESHRLGAYAIKTQLLQFGLRPGHRAGIVVTASQARPDFGGQ